MSNTDPGHRIDLDAYFARIGYTGPRDATLATLAGIQFHHATSVPFENLDVLLGRGIRIDLPSVERKLVGDRRGGYCFEQNTLLLAVLRQMGFAATPLSARVRFNVPREVTPPRTHLFVAVDLGGERYFADCGVGGATPSAPTRFVTDVEQPSPHEARRFTHEGGRYFHQFRTGIGPDGWSDVYEFTGEEMPEIDRVVANHFTSTHPASKFRNLLAASILRPDGTRYSLANRDLIHRRGHEVLSVRTIATADELLDVLGEVFGLRLPPGTRFGPAGTGETPWPT